MLGWEEHKVTEVEHCTLPESHFNLIFMFFFTYFALFQEGYQSDQAVGALTAQKQQEVGTPDMVQTSRRLYQERIRNQTQLSKYT